MKAIGSASTVTGRVSSQAGGAWLSRSPQPLGATELVAWRGTTGVSRAISVCT